MSTVTVVGTIFVTTLRFVKLQLSSSVIDNGSGDVSSRELTNLESIKTVSLNSTVLFTVDPKLCTYLFCSEIIHGRDAVEY